MQCQFFYTCTYGSFQLEFFPIACVLICMTSQNKMISCLKLLRRPVMSEGLTVEYAVNCKHYPLPVTYCCKLCTIILWGCSLIFLQVHAIRIAFEINSLAFFQIVFTVLSSPLVVRTLFLRQLLWLSHLVILEKTPLGCVLAEPGDPLAPNFCSWATRKSYFFHTNHMPGTLDFTVPEQWASFNFP